MLAHDHVNTIIEQVYPADFPEVAEVWEASVRATHHFLEEKDIQFLKPLVLNDYLSQVMLYCVRNPEGKITGFIGTSGNKIEMLFIHPDARGKGIGKRLLIYAIQELQATEVDVNEQNVQGTGFYLHAGFSVTGRSQVDSLGKPFPILHLKLTEQ